MQLKFKKLDERAQLPRYAKDGDAGLDLVAVEITVDESNDKFVEYNTGIAVEIPQGYVGLLFPRSSVSKRDLILANGVGVIDSGYRGPIKARFKRVPRTDGKMEEWNFSIFDIGEVVAQLVVIPIPQFTPEWSERLSETERGEGAFGSTDKQ